MEWCAFNADVVLPADDDRIPLDYAGPEPAEDYIANGIAQLEAFMAAQPDQRS